VKLRIRDGHPRVLVRPDDLSALRRRAATTHAREYRRLLDIADCGATPGAGDDHHDCIWRLAFLHQLSGEARHARLATDGLLKLLELPVSGEYFVGARRLKALAVSYDWLHAALDPALRERIGRQALAYCQALYDSEEIERGSCYLAGHAINQMPFVLMAAIGIGDELGAGEQTSRLIDDMLLRTERQFACYRHFLEQDCFPQSMTYTCTYVGEFPYLFSAFEAGLGIEMYRPHAYFANVIKWWTYGMRDDETFLRFGDYFCAVPVLENGQYYRAFAAVASRYRDGLAQWWIDRFRMDKSGVEPDQILFEERPGVARQSPEQLPRTKFFGPMGLAVARGDFEPRAGAGGTVASFKCTPLYLHNHGHRDANSIAIYHKTDLAVDSGAYDSYETPQWYNYYIRTIAHNTVVVHDPTETFISRGKRYSNDGGQRFINEPHFAPRTIEDVLGESFRDGKVLAHREGDGFSYVCGDASNCYSKSKLRRFLRHVTFVLDHPGKGCVSVLVLDEIELARDGLEARFLLHTTDEPRVADNTVAAVGRFGTERGGRLTATVLLPRSPRIDTIGGEGLEFEVDGKNYALSRKMPAPNVPGAWRAEVIGAGEGRSRRFLTLLVPADADAPAEPIATLEESPATGLLVRQGDLSIALVRGGKPIASDAQRAIRVELAG
jgi:heparin/heparan-sulfate lyase